MDQNTQRQLMQLPTDLLKHILILIAMSSDGAKDIVKVLLISKGLMELALSKDVLKALSFGNQLPSSEFWDTNGLLLKSARAGNLQSQDAIMTRIKAKIDTAHRQLDFANQILEEYNAKMEGRISSIIAVGNKDEIKILNLIAGHTLQRTKSDIQKAESMINAFGRPFFLDQSLLDRFDGLKPKFDKYSADMSLVVEEPDDA